MAEILPPIRAMLAERDYADEPQVGSLVAAARTRFGDSVQAIVLYGSFTRGSRDTLLDLYVLLKDLAPLPVWQRGLANLLSPNVYQIKTDIARAKVAVMTFTALDRGVRSDVAPYFWARFAQPCALVYADSDATRERFLALETAAAGKLVAAGSLQGGAGLDSADFWAHTFKQTYAAELRPERSDRYLALYNANPDYFDAIHAAFSARSQPPQTRWAVRKAAGKTLSFLRIVKSALTFDDPVDYALWKVERHSGVKLSASERQRRYPLIFGWSLVWQLFRAGALK